MIENDKVITLSSGKKFVIIDHYLYENEMYYIASLYTDKVTNNLYILKEIHKNEKIFIEVVNDKNIITKVIYNYKKKEGKD